MSRIMQNGDIENELNKFNPVTLDAISGIRLMNRVEIKYVFSIRKLTELVTLLGRYYQVLEISKRRILPYSTTYLDTEDFLFYYQHIRGKSDRHKIRFRKYEATNETFLEIKRRTNKGRTLKWRIENNNASDSFDSQASRFIREHLPVGSTLVNPVLINRFTRITLAGFDLKERITLDFNITFSKPEKMEELSLPYPVIAELKKEAYSDSSNFKSLIKQLNIYPAGFSKYCVGSALLNDSHKKNMIKPKLLLLNKIENEYTRSDIP
jgi:hypothetical protein